MKVMVSLRLRFALVLLLLIPASFAVNGCAGGWGEMKPTISGEIAGKTVVAGQTETLSVMATGTGPFTYQWYKNGVLVSGATSRTYSFVAKGEDDGAVFTVTVTNAGGSTTTQKFVLAVDIPPAIVTQPASQTIAAGQAATFTVSATGTAPLSYQWYENGTAVTGAHGVAYTTPPAGVANSGSPYTVVVTNAYGTANSAVASLTVTPLTPVLSFAPVPAKVYGNAPFPVSAGSASTGAVTYSVASGPATVSGSTVTLTGTGKVVLGASQAASGDYTAASASTNFVVSPAVPVLSFAPVPSKVYGDAPFAVSASSASNGAVTYSVASGPATISGSTVTLTGAGTVVLNASQAATSDYTAASATTGFNAADAVPLLSFAPIGTKAFGGAPFAVSASSASNGPVTYSVISGPATIAGSTVTLTGVGTVVLGANQAASGSYTAASATASFDVTGVIPNLVFAPVPPKTFGNAPFAVSASSASNGAVTYSVISGPATISGSMVTITGAGNVMLGATQAAIGSYTGATATTTFNVADAVPALAFAPVAPKVWGDAPFAVSASSVSNGAITYSVASGPATIAGSMVTLTGAGTVVLNATQAASGNYATATATTSVAVADAVPNLAFTTIPAQTYGNAPIPLTASSASNGAITYSVISGPGTLSGSTVTMTGVGTIVLGASQAASGNYTSATAATSFDVVSCVTVHPISPAGLTTAPGQQTFSASVTATGSCTSDLTWTATGGTFAGNVWTPPNTPGTYTITATSVAEPTISATTTATISAPVMTMQPASQDVCTNGSATFSVSANYASTYQWNLNGSPVSGATNSSLFIASADPVLDAGNYTATVANAAGTVTSNTATLGVGSSITKNPANTSATVTQTATFSVAATGKAPFTYQWYMVPSGSSTGSAVAGATAASYTTPSLTTSYNGTKYYVIVTDACGSTLTSTSASLAVANGTVPPTITGEPVGVTVAPGGTATFSIGATGTPSLRYQWYRIPAGSITGSAVSGATAATYTVPGSATTINNDQDQYFVVVSNSYGQAASQHARLAVGNGIMVQIVDQPSTAYVSPGNPATFTVNAASAVPMSYQWYKAAPGSSSFEPIDGATSASYTLSSAEQSDSGSVFYVVVSNGVTAAVTSSSASVFVGALANIQNCTTNWNTLGTAINAGNCSYQLTSATTNQYGVIVWPTLISTGNIQLSFTIATSNPSSPPADGFAMVLGDPSLGATLTSTGATGEGLGAKGIPGFVLAFDDYENNANGGWPQDPAVPYLGVGRGESALWENPYTNTNTGIPALASSGQTVSHAYVVSIDQGYMTVTMDGAQVFSGDVSVPPVAYLYFTSSTGGSWEQTVISNISAAVSAP